MTSPLEPFPLFIDSASPESANYFSSSQMTESLEMLAPSSKRSLRRPRISVSVKLSNYIRYRYYQYEVTFGLYMLTPVEKVMLNTVLMAVFSALLYGLYSGLGHFAVRMVCRVVYYITGSFAPAGELCIK